MIGTPKTGTLVGASISAVCFEGLTVTTSDGRPARLAIVDESGQVVADGKPVAEEAWNVVLACYRNFLQGMGHLRVYSRPPDLAISSNEKAA